MYGLSLSAICEISCGMDAYLQICSALVSLKKIQIYSNISALHIISRAVVEFRKVRGQHLKFFCKCSDTRRPTMVRPDGGKFFCNLDIENRRK